MTPRNVHIENVIPPDLQGSIPAENASAIDFADVCEPLEREHLYLLIDPLTLARYCECHIKADKLEGKRVE